MFKKILFITILFYSINSKAEDILDVICDSICASFEKQDVSKLSSNPELLFGLEILKYAQMYEAELKSQYKYDMAKLNSKTGEKLGVMIGEKLVFRCPETFAKIYNNLIDKQDDFINENTNGVISTVQGKITVVEEGEFIYLFIEDKNLKKTKLLYLEHFPGANQLMENYNTLVGKSVIIDYEDKEFFNAKLKEYIYYKVIKQITFVE